MVSYKKELQNRLIFAGIYCAIVLIFSVVIIFNNINDIATAFTLGFAFGIEAVVIVFMVKYRNALKSEDTLKKLYIEENDERRKHVNSMVGGIGINICLLVFALAMLISNYFNKTVFFTLLAATLFIALLKIVLVTYYNKKV